MQVSFVTQEPPRRLKPSLHLRQFPPEPSQAEQWSSHLGTDTLQWPELAPTPRPRPPKMGHRPENMSATTATSTPNRRMQKTANLKLKKLLKPWEKMGSAVPGRCSVPASDIPKAVACWESSAGRAPLFPAIPARKRAARGTCASRSCLLRQESPSAEPPAWGWRLAQTVPEIPGKGCWTPVPPHRIASVGERNPGRAGAALRVPKSPLILAFHVHLKEAESTPTPHLKRRVGANCCLLASPGPPRAAPTLGQGAGQRSSNTAAGRTQQV